MIVAAGALFAAAPASAQTVVIRDDMHGDRGLHRHDNSMRYREVRPSRAEWRHRDRYHHHHRGMRHRGPAIVIQR